MANVTVLDAALRDRVGKGAARAARRGGRLPAVLYGDKKDPLAITLDPRIVGMAYAKPGFFGQLFDIAVDGANHRALCREAGYEGPLYRCSVYGSEAAGERLERMMEMGMSRPWPDALEALTGEREVDATALVEYFEPLLAWLEERDFS